eukprot:6146786-Pleurochrysis_carterae.AAC.1
MSTTSSWAPRVRSSDASAEGALPSPEKTISARGAGVSPPCLSPSGSPTVRRPSSAGGGVAPPPSATPPGLGDVTAPAPLSGVAAGALLLGACPRQPRVI